MMSKSTGVHFQHVLRHIEQDARYDVAVLGSLEFHHSSEVEVCITSTDQHHTNRFSPSGAKELAHALLFAAEVAEQYQAKADKANTEANVSMGECPYDGPTLEAYHARKAAWRAGSREIFFSCVRDAERAAK